MPNLTFSMVPLIAQTSREFWLTTWTSSFFLVGLGILGGLVLLALCVVLFKALSHIPFWEQLSHTHKGAGHAVAAILTALMALGAWQLVQQQGFSGPEEGLEKFLVFLAVLLLSAIVGWALVFCSGRKSADTLLSTLTEGASSILAFVALVVMVIGLLAGLAFRDPLTAITSIPRLFETGTQEVKLVIPGMAANMTPDESPLVPNQLDFDSALLTGIRLTTDRTIVLGDAPRSSEFVAAPRRLQADEELSWQRKDGQVPPIPMGADHILYVQNREVDDATVRLSITTTPPVPESVTILQTAAIILLLGLAILLQQAVAPRASAVALATVKNELGQPLFLVLTVLGSFLIVLFVFLSFYTFGEDIKLLKECGIVVIMLLAAFQGIWSASSSISEEIDGRTALTVLSKPIERRSFVIGKFLGIFWVVTLLFVILGTIELAAVAYKPIYEARENSLDMPTWQDCHREMVATLPGLALGLMQATVLSSISVALATRLPQLANIAVCFGIYIVGHLATAIVSGTTEGFAIVKFVAQLVSTIIPILEHFQMQAAIDAGSPITMSLLCGTLIYCLLYVLLSMFLALLLFEDRDLA